jgi:hypothetical protein
LEALVLHHLDNLDAKVAAVDAFLDEGTDGDGWRAYHRTCGGHFRRAPAGRGAAPKAPPPPKNDLLSNL